MTGRFNTSPLKEGTKMDKVRSWSNYEKGVQDGYHMVACNASPNRGPAGGGEETLDYQKGIVDGRELYRKEHFNN
jgi:hypothetical protein